MLLAGPGAGRWVVVALLVAGVAGGMIWAGLVAWLRDRFSANEILVSLMLVYVAELLLGYLVYGPWKDPEGFNFPQTITFAPATAIPRLVTGYRANWGSVVALASTAAAWLFSPLSYVRRLSARGGRHPPRARRPTPVFRGARWTALADHGAGSRVSRARSRRSPSASASSAAPAGWLWLRRDHRGVRGAFPDTRSASSFSSVLMSMFYIGGELSQSRLGLPKALTGVFQGLLLFALLACDALVERRKRR